MKNLIGAWALGAMLLAAGPAAAENPSSIAAPADNSAALNLFRQGRYAAAYAGLRPNMERGDPEAVFHGLIIRRHGLDGRPPAKAGETDTLTDLLASRADFMRWSLVWDSLPESTADAYRTALAQLLFLGLLPVSAPFPDSPEEMKARRRDEALGLISSLSQVSPANRYPPAMNFAAYLNLPPGGPAYPKKALALARKSAEAGDHLGMLNLSRCYREGLGGPPDALKAAHWARRAADAEPPLARALNEVGYFYETGRGVTRDLTEAALWYAKSAAKKYPPGRQNALRLKNRNRNAPELDDETLF